MTTNSTAIGLFTQEQIDYVNSVPESELRNHLLHQVRLRDNMEYDRDAFEKQLHAKSQQPLLSISDEVINAYEDYIKLLTDELNEVVGMAALHGWKSNRVDQGVAARERIQAVIKQK